MAAWILLIPLVVDLLAAQELQDSRCSESGVVRDPKDCSRFLVCANGQLMDEVQCPPQYAYSELNKTCVPADQVPGCTPPPRRFARATATEASCKQSGPYCDSCDKMVVCATINTQLRQLSTVSCSSINPPQVCDSASKNCVADSTGCPKAGTADNFRCLEPGYYPDPKDCKLYHYCSDNLQHYSDICDYRYDPDGETCVQEPSTIKAPSSTSNTSTTSTEPSTAKSPTSSTDSSTAKPSAPASDSSTSSPSTLSTDSSTSKPSTPSTQLSTITISSDSSKPCIPTKSCDQDTLPHSFADHPAFYLICIPSMVRQTIVYQSAVLRCPEGQVFIDNAQTCQYRCDGSSARFLDPIEYHHFYECSRGSNAAPVRKECFAGLAFNNAKKMCVRTASNPAGR